MPAMIRFYDPDADYGFLANFSSHPVTLDAQEWKTAEHYFQSQKFIHQPNLFRQVRDAPTPAAAKAVAKQNKSTRREDWQDVKDAIMLRAITAKFNQHPALQVMLIQTGATLIVEAAHDDCYWGCGSDGTGLNKMGKLLMLLRSKLVEGSAI